MRKVKCLCKCHLLELPKDGCCECDKKNMVEVCDTFEEYAAKYHPEADLKNERLVEVLKYKFLEYKDK